MKIEKAVWPSTIGVVCQPLSIESKICIWFQLSFILVLKETNQKERKKEKGMSYKLLDHIHRIMIMNRDKTRKSKKLMANINTTHSPTSHAH